eukprot:NODE_926_length_1308_cov_346.396648.p1 GENE.NODE_926_length_1308_cov_346.396648~~NODE_926_length_1308_cov_346.396648.p1  ORF type:complete len:375 (+),score=77.69 NODE_926_length_1308_cov_346.396648:3-1127(+)
MGGCGVALLMNHLPQKTTVMVSHCWGEDMLECAAELQRHIEPNDRFWFCLLALFQAEDGSGPSIAAQVDMKPFETVIEGVETKRMLVVHTSRAELYERLWCVYEIFVAHQQSKKKCFGFEWHRSFIEATMSTNHPLYHMNSGLGIRSVDAGCSSAADRTYIEGELAAAHVTWADVDTVAEEVRGGVVVADLIGFAIWSVLFPGFFHFLGLTFVSTVLSTAWSPALSSWALTVVFSARPSNSLLLFHVYVSAVAFFTSVIGFCLLFWVARLCYEVGDLDTFSPTAIAVVFLHRDATSLSVFLVLAAAQVMLLYPFISPLPCKHRVVAMGGASLFTLYTQLLLNVNDFIFWVMVAVTALYWFVGWVQLRPFTTLFE